MSCNLFLCWISIATLLSTVVLVTDSCSSTFGLRRRGERQPDTLKTVTILPTTAQAFSTMTAEPEETTNDKPSLKDKYDHIYDCDEELREIFCFNGGTCYVHQYRNAKLLQCECPSHFIGEQCQYKALEGIYGGGMVESRVRRSNRQSSNTEPRRVSHSGHKPRVNRRRGSHTKKDHRFKSTVMP